MDVRRLVIAQIGALGLLLAGLLPWIEGVSGYDLARAVGEIGGEVDGLPPAWLGWAWYLLPLLGLVAWLALYLPRHPAFGLLAGLGILADLFCATFLVAALVASGTPGLGLLVAAVSGVLLVAAGWPRRSSTTAF